MSSANKLLQAASGNAGEAVYVDDVFSTDLWDGNGSSVTVTNGIDFSGEGGLVWEKRRSTAGDNILIDTVRGGNKAVFSNDNSAEYTNAQLITSFNSNGYALGSYAGVNQNGETHVGWSFRKQPGFFDVVTYTGNGTTSQSISHNLGSVPGSIFIKGRSTNKDGYVYHTSLGGGSNGRLALKLNTNDAASDSGGFAAVPTDSAFTVNYAANTSGVTYVAYLFAGTGDSDSQIFGDDSDEAIIKCGSYTGTGSSGNAINVGFEPQFVIIKRATGGTGNWMLEDMMRGMNHNEAAYLYANLNSAEQVSSSSPTIKVTATGFEIESTSTSYNTSSSDYIYIAIRRPMKTPDYGTDVFSASSGSSSGALTFTSNFRVDLNIIANTASGSNKYISDRNRGERRLFTDTTDTEASLGINWDRMTGWQHTSTGDYSAWTGCNFKRATGFLDIVAYTGNATSDRDINHNLGVTPELMIVRARDSSQNWVSYDASTGATKYMRLNTDAQPATTSGIWNNTAPTSSVFTVDGTGGRAEVNANGTDYIAYLFATVAGVSKVGSYSGTGSNVDVDCGFSSGARFILIKRSTDSGGWYLYDSHRGIVAGDDPYTFLNDNANSATNTDYIDPLNAGFTVTSSAPVELNTSGHTYIFLAIA